MVGPEINGKYKLILFALSFFILVILILIFDFVASACSSVQEL